MIATERIELMHDFLLFDKESYEKWEKEIVSLTKQANRWWFCRSKNRISKLERLKELISIGSAYLEGRSNERKENPMPFHGKWESVQMNAEITFLRWVIQSNGRDEYRWRPISKDQVYKY